MNPGMNWWRQVAERRTSGLSPKAAIELSRVQNSETTSGLGVASVVASLDIAPFTCLWVIPNVHRAACLGVDKGLVRPDPMGLRRRWRRPVAPALEQ